MNTPHHGGRAAPGLRLTGGGGRVRAHQQSLKLYQHTSQTARARLTRSSPPPAGGGAPPLASGGAEPPAPRRRSPHFNQLIWSSHKILMFALEVFFFCSRHYGYYSNVYFNCVCNEREQGEKKWRCSDKANIFAVMSPIT